MDVFEAHRPHLHAVATRLLGSRAEADDALQEAWIRVDRADHSDVDNIAGWLTTVVSRVCLTMLDARKRRREEALEAGRLPDPVITRADETAPDPEGEALAADGVGAALLVVLETLGPAERLAFVLHDIFAVPFDDIAPIVDRSPDAARQLASRARRRVRGADRDAPTAHRKVVDAFLAAAHSGDFEGLLAVLDPDVVLHADDGSGALQLVKGAREVATRAQFFSAHRVAHPAMIDGAAGFVATEAGQPVSVLAFTIVDGRITAIDALQGPTRLAGLGLEGFVADPGFVVPMKAVLTAERPTGPEWVFERKLDGIRCLAVKDGGRTRLYSRNELSLNDRYAPLAAALDADPADRFVIDGEAVAFVGGRDRFGGGEGGELFYYVFDALFADGRDVRSLPLEERRAVLDGLLRWRGPLRMTEQMTGDGAALLAEACQDGWEGLIAKRLGTPYVSTRSRDWLKLKCTRAQELVIGGFTAPRGSRTDFGALLVGHFDGDRFRYAGKVGTGFTRVTLRDLSERLAPLARETSPFEPEKGIPRTATWVEPELVAQIAFMEWTPDGRLRHPSFLGLRLDKPAREVVREEP